MKDDVLDDDMLLPNQQEFPLNLRTQRIDIAERIILSCGLLMLFSILFLGIVDFREDKLDGEKMTVWVFLALIVLSNVLYSWLWRKISKRADKGLYERSVKDFLILLFGFINLVTGLLEIGNGLLVFSIGKFSERLFIGFILIPLGLFQLYYLWITFPKWQKVVAFFANKAINNR